MRPSAAPQFEDHQRHCGAETDEKNVLSPSLTPGGRGLPRGRIEDRGSELLIGENHDTLFFIIHGRKSRSRIDRSEDIARRARSLTAVAVAPSIRAASLSDRPCC